MIELNKNFVIPSVQADGQDTFTNPLGNDGHPDPCIVYCEQEKCWYGISTSGEEFWGDDKLTLHRAEKFSDLFVNDESRVIYRSNPQDETYGYLWAPELHYIKDKWYIYTSCENSETDHTKHLLVLEAKTDSPFDGFKLCGHLNRDTFAIDPSVYQDTENGKLYVCSSPVIDGIQMLGVQELKSPTESVGEMAIVAKAELPWEQVPPYQGTWTIVEGGYFVKSPNGRLFILYSANG
ncbi:MAG: family 43 glycosylhydrolase, partial [Clostridia bacterium]|nr:family 43 glycosylhydrolase [Clostridia bacterium]